MQISAPSLKTLRPEVRRGCARLVVTTATARKVRVVYLYPQETLLATYFVPKRQSLRVCCEAARSVCILGH